MPWDHCEIEFILDDEPCPSCGLEKAAWTVQVDQTRVLRIGRKLSKREITLRDFGETLDAVHEREGLIVARRAAADLDYEVLVALCRKWKADPANEPDNDPNTWVHPRFLLLPFMDDEQIPADAREGKFKDDGAGPVLEMCRALAHRGVACKESTVFDEDVLSAWLAWRAQQD